MIPVPVGSMLWCLVFWGTVNVGAAAGCCECGCDREERIWAVRCRLEETSRDEESDDSVEGFRFKVVGGRLRHSSHIIVPVRGEGWWYRVACWSCPIVVVRPLRFRWTGRKQKTQIGAGMMYTVNMYDKRMTRIFKGSSAVARWPRFECFNPIFHDVFYCIQLQKFGQVAETHRTGSS